LHDLNVARLFIDFDSISAGNTNVFDRGAIDRQIEMVAWEGSISENHPVEIRH